MIEFCCLTIFVVIVVIISLLLITRDYPNKDTQTIPDNPKKTDGKICTKCGNISPLGSKFCNHCGNEF
jgi:hypothetical protein